jgi:hypothetical protein
LAANALRQDVCPTLIDSEMVRGAVWGELVCGKTFPDLRDFSGNIAILGARIAAHPVRE